MNCTLNAECCPGTLCHGDGYGSSYCAEPQPGDVCIASSDCHVAGVNDDMDCQHGFCCYLHGGSCQGDSDCCNGGSCVGYGCCQALQHSCAQTIDCCGAIADAGASSVVCEANTCCIPSGKSGCTSNKDCCAGSPGCVGGACE